VKALTILPIPGLPEVVPGAPLAALLLAGIQRARLQLDEADVLVVTQKIVSKAEGRIVDLASIHPSERALAIGRETQFDARHVEVILGESIRIVRTAPRVLLTQTRQGFICANAGVDKSNVGGRDRLVLLPADADASAARLRAELTEATGVTPGVIISDSLCRPWREGQVNVAIGAAGVACLRDYRGETDPDGYELQGSVLAVGDELAAAAELVMGKLDRIPATLIRGADLRGDGDARGLIRDPQADLFR
jgi:coenzyme F420-0:L-glutamate ligase / coenzyme F420-1:gamma-L-glutamate ligase